MKSVFKNSTHHALTRNTRVPQNNPCNPCSKTLRITELQGISTFSERIRVIREIRVQNSYAPRLNKDIRVPRQKKNPWFSPPTSPHNSKFIIIHVLNSLQYSCFKAVFDFVYSDVVLVSAKEDLRVYFMFVCFFFDV